jgi:hypothetical protein
MNKNMKRSLLFFSIFWAFVISGYSQETCDDQVTVYVQQYTDISQPIYSGEYFGSVDDYTKFGAEITSTDGPINVKLNPSANGYSGSIYLTSIPEGGTTTYAHVTFSYWVNWSQPYPPSGENLSIVSTHYCKGCEYHKPDSGLHYVVQEKKTCTLTIEIVSLPLGIEMGNNNNNDDMEEDGEGEYYCYTPGYSNNPTSGSNANNKVRSKTTWSYGSDDLSKVFLFSIMVTSPGYYLISSKIRNLGIAPGGAIDTLFMYARQSVGRAIYKFYANKIYSTFIITIDMPIYILFYQINFRVAIEVTTDAKIKIISLYFGI